MDIDITGNSNGLLASQRNQNGNVAQHGYLLQEVVTAFFTQVGSGVKDIDITVNNDSNSITQMSQQGNGSLPAQSTRRN